MTLNEERQHILDQVRAYATRALADKPFTPGETAIPPAGKVLGADEFVNLVDASLDGWLTTGRFNAAFEKKLSDYLAVNHVLTCNSGSSANLLHTWPRQR